MEHPDIRVYPNPASNVVNISDPGQTVTGYELTGMDGKVMLNGIIERNPSAQIHVAHLNNGIYILHLKKTGNDHYVKIIKE
jgi:hypothetical protein